MTGGSLLMNRLGMQAPMQMLWFVEADVQRSRLDWFADELAAGPLGARLVSARVPGARPTWAASRLRPVVTVDPDVPVGDELVWADEQIGRFSEDDLRHGGGWRLSAAAVVDGTWVVSLVVSHTLADGQGVVAAADAAARGDRAHAVADTTGSHVGADVVDALTGGFAEHAKVAAAGVIQFLPLREPARAVRNAVGFLRGGGTTVDIAQPVTTVVAVDSSDLETIAEHGGGTATGLSIAVVANVARAVSGTTSGETAVGMPVSRRADGNAETGLQVGVTTVRLGDHTGRYTDLRDVRARSKKAYAAAGSNTGGMNGKGPFLSSVGHIPDAAADVFEAPATLIPRAQAVRVPVGFPLTTDQLGALRTFNGPITAFTFTSLSDTLADHIETEFGHWEVPIRRRWTTSVTSSVGAASAIADVR
ncbi:hypothetical protein [Williamsia maris]|uniref:hypothetical protein n=1 Tax=Williamsia maris TaxID=72806 RepID=UPI0020A28D4A|nr:hypothetical protein [Williamsia maris]